ncbi:MAG: Hpt domain-containing protein [Deltaproteobacteria bacterium]|nr:Hpt domain-containing protein [Deltaproteobacteria bacterium]MBI3293242.1 Hpt domain-containing protein [Deltaproteobacteria bacterium]
MSSVAANSIALLESSETRASLPAANVLTRVLIRSLCNTLKSEIMFREIENPDSSEDYEYWIEGVVKGEIEGSLGIGADKSTLRSLAVTLGAKDANGKTDLDGALTKLYQSISLELEKQFSQDDFQCRLGPMRGVQHGYKFTPKAGPCLICPVETKFGILKVFFSLEGSTTQILTELMRLGGAASERKVRVFASQIEALFAHVRTLESLEGRFLTGVHIRGQMRSEIKKLKRILHYIKCEPFEMVFVPARRLVNELSKEQGKRVKLVSHGTWLFLDKGLLSYLYDPVLHLIRNAVDHGIEEPTERERRGKPAVGTIRCLAAFAEQGLRMIVSDDGQGLNLERIRRSAVARGVVTSDQAESLMASELSSFVFEPGVTTRERPDAISGRGLGLDNVRKALADIGGSIRILSSSHHGTSFEITVPLDESLQLIRRENPLHQPSNSNEGPRNDLYDELSGYLDRLEKAAKALERDKTASSAYEAHRLVHAVKGVGGFLGWNRVVSYCHDLEDLLKCAADDKLPLKANLLELLSSACHALREFCEASFNGSAYPLVKIRNIEAQLLSQLWAFSHPNEKGQIYFGKFHLKAVRDLIAPASPRSALVAKPDGDFEKAVAQPLGAIVQFSGDRRGYAGILLSEDAFLNVVHPFVTGRMEMAGIQDKLWALNEFARIMGSQLSGLSQKEGIELRSSAPISYMGWGQPLKILGQPTYCYLCEMNGHAFYLVGDFVLPHDAVERAVRVDNFSYYPPAVITESMKLCRKRLGDVDLSVRFDEISSQSDLVGFEGGFTAVVTCVGNPSTILFFSFEASLANFLVSVAKKQRGKEVELNEYLTHFATQLAEDLIGEMQKKDVVLQSSLPSVFLGQAYVANFNRLFLTNKLTGLTPQGRFELNVLVTQIADK